MKIHLRAINKEFYCSKITIFHERTTRSMMLIARTKEERIQKNPLKPGKKWKKLHLPLSAKILNSFCYYHSLDPYPNNAIPTILIRFLSTRELEQPRPCLVSSKGSRMYKSIPTSSLG